jgi:hypothetical protein
MKNNGIEAFTIKYSTITERRHQNLQIQQKESSPFSNRISHEVLGITDVEVDDDVVADDFDT